MAASYLMPTILVVDDDSAIRTLIAALLTRKGIAYELAENGLEAIAKIRRNSYDAIVLDLMMPLSSGFDVIHYLRAERKEMLDCTVVVTAAAERTLEQFDGASVAAVLRKPFDIGELLSTIATCVDVTRKATADRACGGTTPSTARSRRD